MFHVSIYRLGANEKSIANLKVLPLVTGLFPRLISLTPGQRCFLTWYVNSLGSCLLTRIKLITAWISNYIHDKVLHCWCLVMDKFKLHASLYCACDYLSMLGMNLMIHRMKWRYLGSKQNDRHLADDILKFILLQDGCIWFKFHWKMHKELAT